MISYTPIIQHLKNNWSQIVDVLRLDLIDPEISGNKWFKLKQNLEKAKSENHHTILTFGGAFSNHIAATAVACKKLNLKSIGVIRGEEKDASNATLTKAKQNGMQLHFVSRTMYSKKEEADFKQELITKFGKHYLIPEGGNNKEGVLGCMEILKNEWHYDYVFCACGTATTYGGLIASEHPNQKIIGISVLKGENKLAKDTEKLLDSLFQKSHIKIMGNEAVENNTLQEHCIVNTYAFSGYAKCDAALLSFKKEFESVYNIPLDYIYTTKLMYAVFDMVKNNKIPEKARLLVLHSGGLQGNIGFEERYHLTPSL